MKEKLTPDAPAATAPATLRPPHSALLAEASLFLDFDGTLVELAERPDAVCVDGRLRGLVGALAEKLGGRLAVVSGRPVEAIAGYLGDEIAISGSHGLEMRWADGRRCAPSRPEGLDEAMVQLHRFAAERPGVLVEEKPFGAGLHYREADTEETAQAARILAERLASETGLEIQAGKKVFELRAPGADKGRAIDAFMAEAPFAHHRPVFAGDDVTDESGFDAVARRGGAAILIGEPRQTLAAYRLAGVKEMIAWLNASMDHAR